MSSFPRPLEYAFILLAFALQLGIIAVIATQNAGIYGVVAALVGLAFGGVLADFTSGFFHWFFDRCGSRHTTFLGPHFIEPFRKHHEDPEDILRGDFWANNCKSGLGCVPVLAGFLGLGLLVDGIAIDFLLAASLTFSAGIIGTNQFHAWAHMKSPPGFVKPLQRIGLVLSPDHHLKHHQEPYQSHYCITTGVCDRVLLERVKLFQRVEVQLKSLVGGPLGDAD